jgi:hypothetical protein
MLTEMFDVNRDHIDDPIAEQFPYDPNFLGAWFDGLDVPPINSHHDLQL